MIVTKNNQHLHLRSWEYNAARIISHIAKIVTDNGGKVKPTYNAIISDRTRAEAITDYKNRVERYKELEKTSHNPSRAEAIKKYSDRLEKLEALNSDPITVTHTSGIRFICDDVMYYYWVDDNPFFPFHYIKTNIIDGKYSKDVYAEEDKKEWLYDCFFSCDCPDAAIVEAANLIYNMLIMAKNSEKYRETTKKRVPNTYNDGYHFETVYTPERFEKVDF